MAKAHCIPLAPAQCVQIPKWQSLLTSNSKLKWNGLASPKAITQNSAQLWHLSSFVILISPPDHHPKKKLNGNILISLVAEACKVMIVRFPNLLHLLCFMLVAEACTVMIVCNRRRRCVTGQIRRGLVNQRPLVANFASRRGAPSMASRLS